LPSHETLQDLALSTANNYHIRYVLAQDPDSDRFAAAEKRHVENGQEKSSLPHMFMIATMVPGKFSQGINSVQCSPHGFCAHGKLPGNLLVGPWAMTLAGVNDLVTENLAMVASTVSSKMVQRIAHQEGFTFVECLTGADLRFQRLVKY
jgi:phosphomannomutase